MAMQVRGLTDGERTEVHRRVQSRTEPTRKVERARLVWGMAQGERLSKVARQVGVGVETARLWVKRFNAEGLAGLEDRPRSGRPETYTPAQVSAVLATALTDPRTLGLPFACWTLDRLTAYLHERPTAAGGSVAVSRSHLDRLLSGEGLRWRKQETWFGERVDPAFAEKRGPSSSSALRHPQGASSLTSTKWDRKAPRVIRA